MRVSSPGNDNVPVTAEPPPCRDIQTGVSDTKKPCLGRACHRARDTLPHGETTAGTLGRRREGAMKMFENTPSTVDYPGVTALSSNFLDLFTTILNKNHYICYINLT